MKLTDMKCKKLQPKCKAYKISDGAGLNLHISPKSRKHARGRKHWKLKFRIDGKETSITIGEYPAVSLLEAREKRDEYRKLISQNINPTRHKAQLRQQNVLAGEYTFKKVALEWLEIRKCNISENHRTEVLRILTTNLFPTLASVPVKDITKSEFIECFRIIENRGALSMAHRSLEHCKDIMDYAETLGLIDYNKCMNLNKALKKHVKSNYTYLEESEVGDFLSLLDNDSGTVQVKLAGRFLILTMTRTSETINATWDEIDFTNRMWNIPANRMKMKQQHSVPLSNQALNILHSMKRYNLSEKYIFPSPSGNKKPISNNAILGLIYRLKYKGRTTGHGFRSMASTILHEHKFMSDAIERQLAHKDTNKIKGAYDHSAHMDIRGKMMQWYADRLDELTKE